jgi:hypothetical protein
MEVLHHSCERRKSRTTARSQAGVERQPLRAQRAMDTASRSFLCERRRRRRIQSAMREQLKKLPRRR